MGAATDNPRALANRAIREFQASAEKGDEVGIRQAAETGWLAMSSLADVAAAKFGREEPGGYSARRAILAEAETRGYARRGRLVTRLEETRRSLHGGCFHGDKCDPLLVEGLLGDVKDVVDDVYPKLQAKPRRR